MVPKKLFPPKPQAAPVPPALPAPAGPFKMNLKNPASRNGADIDPHTQSAVIVTSAPEPDTPEYHRHCQSCGVATAFHHLQAGERALEHVTMAQGLEWAVLNPVIPVGGKNTTKARIMVGRVYDVEADGNLDACLAELAKELEKG